MNPPRSHPGAAPTFPGASRPGAALRFFGKRLLLALAFAFHSLLAAASPLGAGSPWPGLTLPDQHDKTVSLGGGDLRVVLFAAERKPGDWAQDLIDKSYKEAAGAGRIALVFDISRMPALVTRMFALPGFRARPFPILLARESAPVAFLPHREGMVTVLTLDGGRIAAVDHAGDAASLAAMLAKSAK